MLFFFQGYGDHRDLHSFPTRRSSDLRPRGAAGGRTRRRRWTRAASSETRRCALPAVVREGLVGLGHAVDVVLALERAALLGGGVAELVGQALGHRLLATLARELDQPAHRERARAPARHLHGHLIGGS